MTENKKIDIRKMRMTIIVDYDADVNLYDGLGSNPKSEDMAEIDRNFAQGHLDAIKYMLKNNKYEIKIEPIKG